MLDKTFLLVSDERIFKTNENFPYFKHEKDAFLQRLSFTSFTCHEKHVIPVLEVLFPFFLGGGGVGIINQRK